MTKKTESVHVLIVKYTMYFMYTYTYTTVKYISSMYVDYVAFCTKLNQFWMLIVVQ